MFAELDTAFGPVDALVHSASILASFRVDESDETNVAEVFRANVYSMYFCSREAVRRMSTRYGGKGGAIFNVSSVASRLGGLAGGAPRTRRRRARSTPLRWRWRRRWAPREFGSMRRVRD